MGEIQTSSHIRTYVYIIKINFNTLAIYKLIFFINILCKIIMNIRGGKSSRDNIKLSSSSGNICHVVKYCINFGMMDRLVFFYDSPWWCIKSQQPPRKPPLWCIATQWQNIQLALSLSLSYVFADALNSVYTMKA